MNFNQTNNQHWECQREVTSSPKHRQQNLWEIPTGKAAKELGWLSTSRVAWIDKMIDDTLRIQGFVLRKGLPSRELTFPLDKAYLKMIFLFPRWDMLISWRVPLHSYSFRMGIGTWKILFDPGGVWILKIILGLLVFWMLAGWWFPIFCYFHPELGEDEPILTNIFQMGWFNHQLVREH